MKHLIVAHWKCNPMTLAEAKRLFNSIKNVLPHIEYLWGFDVEIVEKTNGKIKIVL